MRLFLLITLLTTFAVAQFPNVLLDKQKNTFYPCEPSIAISPLDTNLVVAGAVLNKVYYSLDGGKTWEDLDMESQHGIFGDPNILAAEDGRFYYFHLAMPGERSEKSFLNQIVCQTSTDSGKTWSAGSSIGKKKREDQDKEWSVEDPSSGRVYVTWTQFDKYESTKKKHESNILISWSDDKGESWSKAKRINELPGDCLDGDQTTEGAVPAVGPDGEVYVAWARDEAIYFDRSLDGGATWMDEDTRVADQPGGWEQSVPGIYRTNGMPITVCDLSEGPHAGNVYICWADTRNGKEDHDIFLSRSSDLGSTWSEPVRVNDDPAGNIQFLPWLTVDQSTGYLYCVFYDRRNGEGNSTEVYVAYSKDGGQTFTNVKISESPFKPVKNAFFGDYNDISAVQGKIMPVWTRLDKGRTSVWTTSIRHEALERAGKE
ncbi:MAG: sialidase family protein [Bacteroidia bacterium]